MDKLSYLSNAHPEYIESLYQDYRKDPQSVDAGWRKFFEGFEFAQLGNGKPAAAGVAGERQKEVQVLNLINAYRTRGHLFTQTNPVRKRRDYKPGLELEQFTLSEADLDTVFHAGSEIGLGPAKLSDIIEHLKTTYCHSIGAEYMFIRIPERVKWLQQKMESSRNIPHFSLEEKRHILDKLNQAVVFENFLHTKYVGQKRFALSGGETIIPGLDAIIQKGSMLGVQEFVIGMAHRGRLNVLANILKKSYQDIFTEFEGAEYEEAVFEADVKYHLGYSSNVMTASGKKVHLSLAANPSHLEAVNPVVEGMVRAKMDKRYDGDAKKIVPILIHGDAAISAQGIVYEVIQMSLLDGYHTGGTIHLVINNQIGFTTNYLDGRSSTYCTDVAKVTHSPIFHVNADDVEAVVYAILLAMEYRQTFHTDVFIDFLGYRKYGHNEADEPRFTQPRLYKAIAKHPDPREIYSNKLVAGGSVAEGLAKEMEKEFQDLLQYRLNEAKSKRSPVSISAFKVDWKNYRRPADEDFRESPETGVAEADLTAIANKIFQIPREIEAFRKIRKVYEDRQSRFQQRTQFDWAMGEALAYGTLLNDGVPIRLSGQDCERGTFSHRHAVVVGEETEEEYIPLNNISKTQEKFKVYNSPLSEYGVLGFEYGYATAQPKGLTIWEAQFGDFANGAQIIIDQFICCSESKWKRYNGLVMFLPHGYEGQGPEHSSARIERFLSLCAQNNMIVANCTTPASLFHLLRRHLTYPFRIPLVLFTPKSLLRHPECVSPIEAFTGGTRFREVIDDDYVKPGKVSRVLFCSGKIYYDLREKQRSGERKDVALVRLEQLHPFPETQLKLVIERYPKAKEYFWVQEEPENMGPWGYLRRKFKLVRTRLIARAESSSPATGISLHHQQEQQAIVDHAFGEELQHHKVVDITES
ncbi:MAG: 2-oxoglutarate dehydrogenase E1 component [Calditrichae bacterium]|nr:2-oxoglutarate dehydrogenase E1 component [Calditrichia bacterium]